MWTSPEVRSDIPFYFPETVLKYMMSDDGIPIWKERYTAMIEVIVNRPGFEYDIHSLVKAFFPREDVSVRMQEEFREDTRLCMAVGFTDSLVQAEFFEEKESKGKGAQESD